MKTGIILILVTGLATLTGWVSPRLFRLLMLILSFVVGAVVVTSTGFWFWTLGHPVFALPVLSIAMLGAFLFVIKRRALVLWAIATLYLILVLPIPEASPVLLGVPGGVMAWFVTRRVIEEIRNRRTKTGQSNNTPEGICQPADGSPKPSV